MPISKMHAVFILKYSLWEPILGTLEQIVAEGGVNLIVVTRADRRQFESLLRSTGGVNLIVLFR